MAQEESEGRDWGSALGEGFRRLILVGRNRLGTVWRNGEAGVTVTELYYIEAHAAPASAEERDRSLLVPFSSSFSS